MVFSSVFLPFTRSAAADEVSSSVCSLRCPGDGSERHLRWSVCLLVGSRPSGRTHHVIRSHTAQQRDRWTAAAGTAPTGSSSVQEEEGQSSASECAKCCRARS